MRSPHSITSRKHLEMEQIPPFNSSSILFCDDDVDIDIDLLTIYSPWSRTGLLCVVITNINNVFYNSLISDTVVKQPSNPNVI